MESAKHRTQVSIEDWQYQTLMDISRKTKKSMSNIIRDLISEKYSGKIRKAKSDPIFGIVGIGTGDRSPAAKEHDKFLYGKRK